MKKIILFLISSICYTYMFSQTLSFNHLGIKDGLSQSTVKDIFQDEYGQLWFATRDGLNKYDGNKMEVYKSQVNDSTTLFSSDIRQIKGNLNGKIYIRCLTGLVVYDVKSAIFKHLFEKEVSNIYYGKDRLWVSYQNNLNYLSEETMVLHSFKTLGLDETIRTIIQTSDECIYVGTNRGTLRIDKQGEVNRILDEGIITCLYEDSKKQLWIGTSNLGLYCYTKGNNIINYRHNSQNDNAISNNFIRGIVEDDFGNYWIGTYSGLDYWSGKDNTFINYTHSIGDKHAISDFSVQSILKDKQGSIWIGTFFGGVNIINPNFSFKQYFHSSDGAEGLSGEIVSNVLEDKKGNLWICTDNAGLNYYDSRTKRFQHFKKARGNINSLSSNVLKSLCLDEDNNSLWIGSHRGGLDRLDIRTHKITRTPLNTGDPQIDNYIRCILKYENKLILGTHNSVHFFDPSSNKTSAVINDSISPTLGQIWDMIIDNNSQLWLSTATNVYIVNLKTNETRKISDKIGKVNLSTLFEDSKRRVWIGSAGQGLYMYNPTTDEYVGYNMSNSDITDNNILDIEETQSGAIILATNSGLARFEVDENCFKSYSNNQFFPFDAFNERSLYVTTAGEIVLCSINGMMIIEERDFLFEPKPYDLNFTNLKINNSKIRPLDASNILVKNIMQTDTIVLKESHSVFSIDVFTNNYLRAIRPNIKYKLAGFDTDWVDASDNKTIAYTNLDAGSYTLSVKATDNFSTYETPIRNLTVVVEPYFFKTWYAYLFYSLLLVGIFYIFISRILLKNSLKYAEYKAAHISEVNESKMRFFINVSHEIRTPITLISAQIDYLLNDSKSISQAMNNRLLNMKRNANKLRDLINELLDFRKHEQGFASLEIEEIEIVRYLKNILNTFKEYARSLHVKSGFESEVDNLAIYLDSVQIDKVFYNLLSNAFKFTPKDGKVTLSLKKEENSVIIAVSDTGVGMRQEDVEQIFNRFYQIKGVDRKPSTRDVGTGIGLSLVKNIVELHNGNITVLTNESGGTTFQITLLLGTTHFQNRDDVVIIKDYESNQQLPIENKDSILETNEKIESISENENKHCIYIVEDNADIRKILVDIFSTLYNVKDFADAEDAYMHIEEDMPSLAILDVMLPNMSGIELCSKIKSNLATYHIPVVILTAASSLEKKIHGLQHGADDYISKPFDLDELVVRCNNLVSNRVSILNYLTSMNSEKNVVLGISDSDRAFVSEAEEIVRSNISNLDFSVDDLSQHMKVARTTLFVKLKEIVGMTPNKFILGIRLKVAVELLKNDLNLSINELAYAVGYHTPSYFIRIFKSHYGVTPNEYKKNEKSL